jgi:hypothetical protein
MKSRGKSVQVVAQYGTMWARNAKNIKLIPDVCSGGVGIYILFDGSMPVYVGKGNIKERIVRAKRSKSRGQKWDRFSWYALNGTSMMHDIEVLALRMFPLYLRPLTKNDGHFVKAKRAHPSTDKIAECITRKP